MSAATAIQQFIADELLQSGGEAVGPDDELIISGLIDSLMVMRLIHFIDETFGVEISATEVVPENFSTINVIAALVARKSAARSNAG